MQVSAPGLSEFRDRMYSRNAWNAVMIKEIGR
jgi:hypothetical protein